MAFSQDGLSPARDRRIGPNAITRVAEALREESAEAEVARLFACARLGHYLKAPPQEMVDEEEVTRLHRVLRSEMGVEAARRIGRASGVRTGDYLLANRIPLPVQRLLSLLPPRLASRLLIKAIERHSWTFAGSGELRVRKSYPPRLSIQGCCICRDARGEEPVCDFYTAAIERLFRALVHPAAAVSEIACSATGSDACTFEVTW